MAPYWTQVQAHVDADRATRTRAMLDGGCEALLNSYRPLMRWEFPVLDVGYTVLTLVLALAAASLVRGLERR